MSEYICIENLTRTNVRIHIRIENCTNIRIFIYFLHSNTLMNKYPNIFVSKNLHEQISEYIHLKFLTQTNVRLDIGIGNCANIRIYSNIHLVFTL